MRSGMTAATSTRISTTTSEDTRRAMLRCCGVCWRTIMRREQKFAVGVMAGIGAALVAGRLARARHAIDFEGRIVVITGGSRGLGLVMARMFVDEGARVVLLARDLGELARAGAELEARGGEVMTLRCDVRR